MGVRRLKTEKPTFSRVKLQVQKDKFEGRHSTMGGGKTKKLIKTIH